MTTTIALVNIHHLRYIKEIEKIFFLCNENSGFSLLTFIYNVQQYCYKVHACSARHSIGQ